jgi:hypothetical protein
MKDYYPNVKFKDGVYRFDLPNGDEFVIVPKQNYLAEQCLKMVESYQGWANDAWGRGYATAVGQILEDMKAILKKASFTCNGFCGEQECKENQDGCKRIKKASEK